MGWGGKQLQQVLSFGQTRADMSQPLVRSTRGPGQFQVTRLVVLFFLSWAENIWIQRDGGHMFISQPLDLNSSL